MQGQQANSSGPAVSHDDVMRILGPMDDGKCAAIMATGALIGDLEEVAAWVAGEDDVMGEMERALNGVCAEVYDLLTADEKDDEER